MKTIPEIPGWDNYMEEMTDKEKLSPIQIEGLKKNRDLKRTPIIIKHPAGMAMLEQPNDKKAEL